MSDLEDALVDAIKLASGVDDLDVRIRDRSSRWFSDLANVTIAPLGIRRVGVDETRRRTIDGERREVIHGNRILRFQIAVDGASHEIGATSADLADAIVAGLEREDVRAILRGANLSRATCGSVAVVPMRGDNDDERSLAVFEVAFNTSREVVGAVIGYVETAPADGTLT